MALQMWEGSRSRRIIERILVEGILELLTPTHFGNGDSFGDPDSEETTDMPLLVDAKDGKSPLLTGASLIGAMRSYLREREHGYGQRGLKNSYSTILFGGLREDDIGEQSPLVADDSIGRLTHGIEMRDGVQLKPESRTAADKKKFDLQLWPAGTEFDICFELAIREYDDAAEIKRALATALEGLNDGGVTLGARKRRGYGQIRFNNAHVTTYNLQMQDGLVAWLQQKKDSSLPLARWTNSISLVPDNRRRFDMSATFQIDGSLLIRSGFGQNDVGPDTVHLHSRDASGNWKPTLSGTSLGGALRARARKIARTIKEGQKAEELIGSMFGVEMKKDAASQIKGVVPCASRLQTTESFIENGTENLVQNRVSIDRFTGGARDTALFNEQPVHGGEVKIKISLRNPQCYEIGLLLLLLKDLWTSDLPLGGESSVGRGRLKGKEAALLHRFNGNAIEWRIDRVDEGENSRLSIVGDRNGLEMYVAALHTYLEG